MSGPNLEPEVLSRLQAALARAERFSPTLVSLDVKRAEACAAFASLGEQAGTTIECPRGKSARDRMPPVTMRFEGIAFWDALQRVYRSSGTQPRPWAGAGGIRVEPSTFPFAERSCVSGPIFFTATGPARQADGSLLLDVWAYADPKVKVVRAPARAVVTDVLDKKASPIVPLPTTTRSFAEEDFAFRDPSGGAWSWLLKVVVPAPGDDVRSLPVVRGKAPFELRSGSERWQIDRPTAAATSGASRQAGPWELVFRRAIAPHPASSGIPWRFEFDLMTGKAAPHDVRMAMRYLDAFDLEVLTADGERFRRGSFRNVESVSDGSRIKLTYFFLAPPPAANGTGEDVDRTPARMVLDLPTDVITLDVPFEFVDLRVPPRRGF
jgi:hypothetical protein